MKKKEIIQTIKESHIFDMVSKKKNGNYIGRSGYFYRPNKDHRALSEKLHTLYPVTIIDSGDHWAAFRGGQSIAQGSHFWVEFQIDIDPKCENCKVKNPDCTLCAQMSDICPGIPV